MPTIKLINAKLKDALALLSPDVPTRIVPHKLDYKPHTRIQQRVHKNYLSTKSFVLVQPKQEKKHDEHRE
jgi:hypothetical protein